MTDVVVTGASGAAGRAVIEALRGRGAEVAAVSHSDEGKAALREAGVEQVFDGDLTEPASLRAAFAEARAVYSIPPALHPREGVLIENAVAAAVDAGVERFVFHSVLHPHTPLLRNHMRKAQAESALRDSSLSWTILQPSIFAQFLVRMFASATPGVVGVPFDADAPIAVLDLAELAEVAAAVLLDDGHEYATYELAGQLTTLSAVAAAVGRRRGIELRAETIPPIEAPLPPPVRASPLATADLISTFAEYDAHGFKGNPRIFAMLLGHPPGSVEQVIEREIPGP